MSSSPPTDQRASVRPISFVLRGASGFGTPINLKIRPEDLTRTEPSRVAVHQTLGRGIHGWADNFGAGLPSVVISGHTGWRASGYSGEDGYNAFMALNALVYHGYHQEKQAAIDSGRDPASVQLIFVDVLDGFAWNVAPMVFVLRRNRSRPLLLQYNITLQAVSAELGQPSPSAPMLGTIASGLSALAGVIGALGGDASGVNRLASMVASAGSVMPFGSLSAPSAPASVGLPAAARDFVDLSVAVLQAAHGTILASSASRESNAVSAIAGSVAQAGGAVFRSMAATQGLPMQAKTDLARLAGTFNEAACIISNSLRPRGVYEDFEGLYGASNCSSTTGGRLPSAYADTNPFELLTPKSAPITLSSPALASISTINRSDIVLAPMPVAELTRHLQIINAGVSVRAPFEAAA